ncbi:MAG: hypothetical protein DI527_01020 [Chelatococcus sp.]|nr:MAG: hypothetical protein DI527_01020 [Chelatococcus sp.]
MPRVTFARDFDCWCRPGVYIAYRAGQRLLVPTSHARRARAAGVLADAEPENRREPGASAPSPGADSAGGARGGGGAGAGRGEQSGARHPSRRPQG